MGGWLIAEHSLARFSRALVDVAKAVFVVVVAVVFVVIVVVVTSAVGAPSCPPRPRACSADALWTTPTFSLVSRGGSACAAVGGAKTGSACRRAIAGRRLRWYQGARHGSARNRQDFLDESVHPGPAHQSNGEDNRCACVAAHAKDCAWRKEGPERASARRRHNRAAKGKKKEERAHRLVNVWLKQKPSDDGATIWKKGWALPCAHVIGASGVVEKKRERLAVSGKKSTKRKVNAQKNGKCNKASEKSDALFFPFPHKPAHPEQRSGEAKKMISSGTGKKEVLDGARWRSIGGSVLDEKRRRERFGKSFFLLQATNPSDRGRCQKQTNCHGHLYRL